MGDFKLTPFSNNSESHWQLFQQTLKAEKNFSNFNTFYKRIFNGQFLVHKNHFRLQRVCLFRKNQLKIAALVFLPNKDWPGPAGMGGFAVSADASNETIHEFWQGVKTEFKGVKIIAPYLGHHYLGFSLPIKDGLQNYQPAKVGFMTTAGNPLVEELFEKQYGNTVYRRYYSLETLMTQELIQNLQTELQEKPSQFQVRNFNFWKAKEDLAKMNQLVNQIFTEHHDFSPLTDEENWDIMKWGIPLLQKGTFLFLMDGDKEIGFAFATMDYNTILRGRNEALNLTRAVLLRSKIRRGRLIHIGIKKEYRGQKLVKYLRHQLLLNLHALGAEWIESSYIDEGNQASLGNVKSTQAQPLNTFATYSVSSVV